MFCDSVLHPVRQVVGGVAPVDGHKHFHLVVELRFDAGEKPVQKVWAVPCGDVDAELWHKVDFRL